MRRHLVPPIRSTSTILRNGREIEAIFLRLWAAFLQAGRLRRDPTVALPGSISSFVASDDHWALVTCGSFPILGLNHWQSILKYNSSHGSLLAPWISDYGKVVVSLACSFLKLLRAQHRTLEPSLRALPLILKALHSLYLILFFLTIWTDFCFMACC